MSPIYFGLIGIALLFLLLASGMPIGFVMALVGFIGYSYLTSLDGGLTILGITFYSTSASYDLSVFPLFILMGQFAAQSDISEELYDAVNTWIGHFKGGLAMATIGACAAFAAICGSSLASAATMGTVAVPQMKKYNYDVGLAGATVAAGGTLGDLIPPSVAFAFFGILTDQSIGKLFIAGILPGILLTALFMLSIYFFVTIKPKAAPLAPRANVKAMASSVKNVWGTVILFALVIGGLYTGIFTPTEAGAVGAFGALVLIIIKRKLTSKNLFSSLLSTATTSAMCFIILIGAFIFSYFLAVTRLPTVLADWMVGLNFSKYIIFTLVVVLYIVLGCFMDGFSMLILTIPVIFPEMLHLGFDPIWFGVIVVILIEMGMITPPIGINIFIVHGIMKDAPMYTLFRGITPFVVAMLVCIFLLVAFPQIVLFFPSMMAK